MTHGSCRKYNSNHESQNKIKHACVSINLLRVDQPPIDEEMFQSSDSQCSLLLSCFCYQKAFGCFSWCARNVESADQPAETFSSTKTTAKQSWLVYFSFSTSVFLFSLKAAKIVHLLPVHRWYNLQLDLIQFINDFFSRYNLFQAWETRFAKTSYSSNVCSFAFCSFEHTNCGLLEPSKVLQSYEHLVFPYTKGPFLEIYRVRISLVRHLRFRR